MDFYKSLLLKIKPSLGSNVKLDLLGNGNKDHIDVMCSCGKQDCGTARHVDRQHRRPHTQHEFVTSFQESWGEC